MSSEVTYSTKNYRNDWISQFGLYRYESAASPKRIAYERRSKLVKRICLLLVTMLLLALLIFYIAVYINSLSQNDHRMTFPTKIEPGSRRSMFMNPLTTVFYPDDQISSYQRTLSSTTPMPSKRAVNESQLARILKSESVNSDENATVWYPANHKRQYSNVHRHKSDFESNIGQTRKPPIYPTPIEKRTIFPEENDNIDYTDTNQNVNSIQDIINQSNENENNDEHELISSSMPFSRAMKVEGFYRREKKKHDDLSTMETIQSGTINSLYRGGDPFLKFKPHSPGDVNLLAANIMKINKHLKPRPLRTPINGFYDNVYSSQDPQIIYHQIIAANNKNREASIRNRRFEKTSKNNKPFSLMLDVYPMHEDETQAFTSTRMTPYIPYNQHQHQQYQQQHHQRPFYPIDSLAINHNLQYNKENSFYNHLKFPQLQPYPSNRLPYVIGQNPKDTTYRDWNRMNTNVYRPILKPPRTSPADVSPEERPSQITVHLNLYPDHKKYATRNVEIVEMDGNSVSKPSRDDLSLWKRLERENTTKLQTLEVESIRGPYIPPFSAIKINSLQQPFDINDSNWLSQSQQPDKSIEFDMVPFDSKKLVPHIKSINVNPTANSPVPTAPSSASTSSSSSSISSYFDDVPSTFSTIPTADFETTMSSSIYSSTPNHFPFYSTQIPFETTATVEVLNESKWEQPTVISGNTIRFQD